MRKFILSLMFLIPAIADAQPNGYLRIPSRYEYSAGKFLQIHLPAGSGAPVGLPTGIYRGAGAVYLDTVANQWYYWQNLTWHLWTAGGGGGGVTSVGSAYGLLGGPITTTGSLRLDSATVFPQLRATIPASSSGTVTSVATGFGLTGGPVTTSGTIQADSNYASGVATSYRFNKVRDSLAGLIPSVSYPVTTVFGRSGDVVAATNDYTWAQIDKSTSSLANITTRLFSDLQSKPTTIAGYGITDGVTLAGSETLTNKTITSPLGIVKGDVGLGNVDNTSDATKNAASATLSNKTLASPVFSGSYSFGGTPTFPTFNQNTTGSAATLTTPRAVYGSNFNGSADITGPIIGTYGGTGVNNSTRTITIAGNLVTVGAFTTTLTATGTTGVTLPTTGTLSTLAGSETFTNKTLTSPVINTPTGIVKGDVGLGNVDNTSDATKNSATATLTNKRWTARVGSTTSSATPTINTDNVDVYKLTALAANITSMTTNLSGTPNDGDVLVIEFTGTATRTITWGASFVSSTVSLPTTTSGTTTLTVVLHYFTTSSYGNNKWVCANYY